MVRAAWVRVTRLQRGRIRSFLANKIDLIIVNILLHTKRLRMIIYLPFLALILIPLITLGAPNAVQAQQESAPGLVLTTDKPELCLADTTTVTVNLDAATDLYGYQFTVIYDPELVSLTGAFVNTFFDTSDPAQASVLWAADCTTTPGVCKFAAGKIAPGAPVSGSGGLATLTLTGLAAGEFDLAFGESFLADSQARPIAHGSTPLHITVCDVAMVNLSGKIALQGRAGPGSTGEVTLTDLDGNFGPYVGTFDATDGVYTFNNVKVLPAGSNYRIEAKHSLYLSSQATLLLLPGQSYPEINTQLRGGDANNNGIVDIDDLACIGGALGIAPASCGETGGNDVNADGIVNIFDVVLVGANYALVTPQPW